MLNCWKLNGKPYEKKIARDRESEIEWANERNRFEISVLVNKYVCECTTFSHARKIAWHFESRRNKRNIYFGQLRKIERLKSCERNDAQPNPTTIYRNRMYDAIAWLQSLAFSIMGCFVMFCCCQHWFGCICDVHKDRNRVTARKLTNEKTKHRNNKFNGVITHQCLEYAYDTFFFVVAPNSKWCCYTAQLHTSFNHSALVLVFTISWCRAKFPMRVSVCVCAVLVLSNGFRWK